MDILQKIVKSTKARVERDKAQISFNAMREKAENLYKIQVESSGESSTKSSGKSNVDSPMKSPFIKPPFAFEKALDSRESKLDSAQDLAQNSDSQPKSKLDSAHDSSDLAPQMRFICEVKKASPSKGIIAHDFPYLQIALDYERAGADCISCLTEPEFFCGADSYLSEIAKRVKIPILRKDFIIDSYMIYQAKVLGADCVLLISEILECDEMREFCDIAHSLGLSVLVESHSESALQNALNTNARLIGVNNRDLRDFKVDLQTSVRLKKLVPKDRIFVSESGIATHSDIALLQSSGINAALIGETLMREKDKTNALNALKGVNL
ncbi:indole-3-glycerol phosphate synthase TrpC [Helicobacter sp. MIT 01-3238]|uniref:indole-3-glycerol phosphate synthase TrpC n=1 Tax=Helicobacter sp. MIT 01-3238 TaxID=398627 RepID=UPI001C69B37D|nr:indole-3-glycerol phosphate synthase TrpC [Helicobacter sp. MIT 01-3238]